MKDKTSHAPPAQDSGDGETIYLFGEAGRDLDEAWYKFTRSLYDAVNHNRLLIAAVQGLSRFLAWLGGHREDANNKTRRRTTRQAQTQRP